MNSERESLFWFSTAAFVSKLHCSQTVDDEVDAGISIPECTGALLFANAKCPQKNVRKYVARNIFASLLRI